MTGPGGVLGDGDGDEDGEALRRVSQRVALLLDELHQLLPPPDWSRLEQLVQSLVDLYGGALGRLAGHAHAAADLAELRRRVLDDELLASLLLLHGLHPRSVEERIRAALAQAEPSLGRVELVGIEGAAARVSLSPEAAVRVQPVRLVRALEQLLGDAAPELGAVIVEGLPEGAGAAGGGGAAGRPGALVQIDLRRGRQARAEGDAGASEVAR